MTGIESSSNLPNEINRSNDFSEKEAKIEMKKEINQLYNEINRSNDFSEKEAKIEMKNKKKIDEILNKLGYKFDHEDGKAGIVYKNNSNDTLSLYGGMFGVPKNKELTEGDVVSNLFKNKMMKTLEDRNYINESLSINIPPIEFNSYEFKNKELKDSFGYVKYYKYLSPKEGQELKDFIIKKIIDKTGIRLDSNFELTYIENGRYLVIDGKWIDKENDNFGKVESLDINFDKNEINIKKIKKQ